MPMAYILHKNGDRNKILYCMFLLFLIHFLVSWFRVCVCMCHCVAWKNVKQVMYATPHTYTQKNNMCISNLQKFFVFLHYFYHYFFFRLSHLFMCVAKQRNKTLFNVICSCNKMCVKNIKLFTVTT